ncbi:hypothetical protein [Agarivorans sp.]|uniref:hypothetical protein n=1 Tax=Agarivorans sp. TaxID=1872412 RepID=UPI003CFCCB91
MRTLIVGLMLLSVPSLAANIHLRLPAYADNSHLYYHQLLERVLLSAGHQVTIEVPADNLPQKRAESMLRSGDLSVMWLLASKQRDQDPDLIAIKLGLTQGLVGQRILLVPPSEIDAYRSVTTLEEFRQLNKTGGFGKHWFDVAIWHANHLKAQEIDGEWRRLYKMVAKRSRGVDYFSRGFTEVVNEASLHPELAIEPHLILQYDSDFQFYLSASQTELAQTLTEALQQARANGLLQTAINDYWQKDFDLLNYAQRTKIKLFTPN